MFTHKALLIALTLLAACKNPEPLVTGGVASTMSRIVCELDQSYAFSFGTNISDATYYERRMYKSDEWIAWYSEPNGPDYEYPFDQLTVSPWHEPDEDGFVWSICNFSEGEWRTAWSYSELYVEWDTVLQ